MKPDIQLIGVSGLIPNEDSGKIVTRSVEPKSTVLSIDSLSHFLS